MLSPARASFAVAATCGLIGLAAAQELVTNGGFETGDFTGWSLTGNDEHDSVDGSTVRTGAYAASLGPVANDAFLTQTLATTPGASYTVSFWLANDGDADNDFAAQFGTTTIASLTNAAAFDYTQYAATVAASTSSTELRFAFHNDPAYWYLDDVSVQAVPEPASVTALGLALAGLAVRRRRHR